MIPAEHIAFDDHGQIVPTVDFDYAALDHGEEAPAPPLDAGAVLLAVLLAALGLVLDGRRDSAGVGRRALLAAYL
ncbi:MAG TPA: hypothetical protein PKM43_21320, partial [Verrucomicrobiota bacterium]|nr:hypothetical protein [Verrucomicrobiota bacterium]